MTVPSDPYNFTNGATADGDQVDARFAPLYAALNGALDVDNVLDAVLEKMSLNDGATIRRGKSIIVTSESRTNTAYGTLTTPDQVANVVVPANALLAVYYHATWEQSASTAARAAIFLGSNQVKLATAAGSAAVQEASIGGTTSPDVLMGTYGGGLISMTAGFYTGDVTTGQIVGGAWATQSPGFAMIFVAAGTYTVSVQFKASAGSVTVKNRKLFVSTVAF